MVNSHSSISHRPKERVHFSLPHRQEELLPAVQVTLDKVKKVAKGLDSSISNSQCDPDTSWWSKTWSWVNEKVSDTTQYVQNILVPMEVIEDSFGNEEPLKCIEIDAQDICSDEQWLLNESSINELENDLAEAEWHDAAEESITKSDGGPQQAHLYVSLSPEEVPGWSKNITRLISSALPGPALSGPASGDESDQLLSEKHDIRPIEEFDENEGQGIASKLFESSVQFLQVTAEKTSEVFASVSNAIAESAVITTIKESVQVTAGSVVLQGIENLGEFTEEKAELERELLEVSHDKQVVESISRMVSTSLQNFVTAIKNKGASALRDAPLAQKMVKDNGLLTVEGQLMLEACQNEGIRSLLTNQILRGVIEAYKVADQLQGKMLVRLGTDCLSNMVVSKGGAEEGLSSLDVASINVASLDADKTAQAMKEAVLKLLFPNREKDIKIGKFADVEGGYGSRLQEMAYQYVENTLEMVVETITDNLTSPQRKRDIALQAVMLAADTLHELSMEEGIGERVGTMFVAQKSCPAPVGSVSVDEAQITQFTTALRAATYEMLHLITSKKLVSKLEPYSSKLLERVGPALARKIAAVNLTGLLGTQIIAVSSKLEKVDVVAFLTQRKKEVSSPASVSAQTASNDEQKLFEAGMKGQVDRLVEGIARFMPQTEDIVKELISNKQSKLNTKTVPGWFQSKLLVVASFFVNKGLRIGKKILSSKQVSKGISGKVTASVLKAVACLKVVELAKGPLSVTEDLYKNHKCTVK